MNEVTKHVSRHMSTPATQAHHCFVGGKRGTGPVTESSPYGKLSRYGSRDGELSDGEFSVTGPVPLAGGKRRFCLCGLMVMPFICSCRNNK
jgi:hypothetical protein